jgi:hypothetical protein
MEEFLMLKKPVIDDIKQIDFTMVKLKLRDLTKGRDGQRKNVILLNKNTLNFLR